MFSDIKKDLKINIINIKGKCPVYQVGQSFYVKDGLGIKMLTSKGVEVVIITGRKSKVVEYRAKELGIRQVWQGINDKRALCRQIIGEKGLRSCPHEYLP